MCDQLGAGTAMPSLALLAQLLSHPMSTTPPRRKFHFTFADYNAVVLRLVTLPNILLTWKVSARQTAGISEEPVSNAQNQQDQEDDGELDIDPQLLDSFRVDLERRGITIEFVSGAWSPSFVDLVLQSRNPNSGKGCHRRLVLASETIYSPSSLNAFAETLLALLRAPAGAGSSRALVAAKRVYFGVGGGVDEFLMVLREVAGEKVDVQQKVEIKTEGVGRVVLQVRPAAGQ